MEHWSMAFNVLTTDDAWGYVRTGDDGVAYLLTLLDTTKAELAGLSAFGKSGDPPDLLKYHVEIFVLTDQPPVVDQVDVRAGLTRLGIPEPQP